MSFSAYGRSEEDPVALVESCFKAITWILRCHRGRPLRRSWIDQFYGEEEITRLEQELLPAMEEFLERIGEIDALLELKEQAKVARIEAARSAGLELEIA